MQDIFDREAALALLSWYRDQGVAEATEDRPVNRLLKKEAQAPVPQAGRPSSPPPAASSDVDALRLAEAVRKLADDADTLAALEKAVREFDALSVCKTATNTVFCDGVAGAPVMVIGEAPGAEEDAQGVPFCGASGQLLEQALNSVHLYRKKNYYISNILFWRPPGNRKPTEEETAVCLPFTERHIALAQPSLLILTGATSVQALLNDKTGITRLRGQFRAYKNRYMEREIPAVPIFHPSYLLRSPGQKRYMWHDMLAAEEKLMQLGVNISSAL